MVRRLVLAFVLALVAACDPGECEPSEVDPTHVRIVVANEAECTAVGATVWQAIGWWRSHGVRWTFGGCVVEQHDRDLVVSDGLSIPPLGAGVTLYVVDSIVGHDEDHAGFVADDTDPCEVVGAIKASASTWLVAHELGHAAGLDHTDDVDDVMHSHPGITVTPREVSVASYAVGVLPDICS